MSDDAENWKLLQVLFHLADTTPEADRDRVLEQHCADPVIRARAMDIFRSSNDINLEASAQLESILVGRRFGPYKLIRHLGSGGIGAVYLAERIFGGSSQRSALKVLAPHAAGAAFVERFHREQHILSSLDHPNITRMLDAGVAENGEPYLVMEYVEGVHLDAYCEERNLGIPMRLQLFLNVCDAVSYAHRNLVVHLDLKPSNVLVTDDGAVKLLDFGTSKLIQMDSLLTTTVLATPAYASPEQLRNEPVTTACDVYALGAILFELLSGRRPADKSSVAVMIERAMKELRPEPMSQAVTSEAAAHRGVSESRLRQLLSGDLGTIVAKCLSPRSKDRYPTVDALITDIQRFMSERPILARPQTTLYWIGKFVRRNRASVSAVALVVLLLLGSLGYAEWRQQQALREGLRAEHMQTFMYALFSIAQSNYIGKPTMSVDDFLMLGVKILPLYIHDRADLRTAQLSLGQSLLHNSDYQDAQVVFAEVTNSAQADKDINAETESTALSGDIAFRQGKHDQGKALTKRALLLSRSPHVTPSAQVTAKTLYALNREVNGLVTDENVELLQQAVQQAKDNRLPLSETAMAVFGLARTMEYRNRLDEAKSLFRQTIQLDQQDPAYTCTVIEPEGELGHIEMWQGHFAESLADNQRAYDTAVHCFGVDAREALFQERLVAQDLIWLGRGAEAVQKMEKAVQEERRLDKGAGGSYLANALYVLATAEEAVGHPEEAEKLAKEEMEMAKGKLDPASRAFATIYLVYGIALADQHLDHEAFPYAEMADKAMAPALPNETYVDQVRSAQAHQLLLKLQSRRGATGSQAAEASGKVSGQQ